MRHLLIGLIRLYQRHLSPHKGYGCALRTLRGHGSGCSGVGLRLLRRHGVWHGLRLLRLRLQRCAQAAQTLRQRALHTPRPLRAQRGDCDCGFDGCDLDGGDLKQCRTVSDCLPDVASCDSCGERRRRRGDARRESSPLTPWLWALGLLLVLGAVHYGLLPAQQWWAWLSGWLR